MFGKVQPGDIGDVFGKVQPLASFNLVVVQLLYALCHGYRHKEIDRSTEEEMHWHRGRCVCVFFFVVPGGGTI